MCATASNPLLEQSDLPCRLPRFSEIRPEHFPPALAAARAEAERELDAIAANTDPPTFANTIEPLERCGLVLHRVRMTFITIVGSQSTTALLDLEPEVSTIWSTFRDRLLANPEIFARVAAVRASDERLAAEQAYLVTTWHKRMASSGAGLGRADRDRLSDINHRIGVLSAEFSRRLQAEHNDLAVVVNDQLELDGLTPDQLRQARQAADRRGHAGKHLIPLQLPTSHTYLRVLTNRDVRRRIMEASLTRARRGGENDTTELVVEIASLRAEKAQLLGHPSFASWATTNETAGSPAAVTGLLRPLAASAAETAADERRALEGLAGGSEIKAWDWPFYAEHLRREADFDTDALRPYFEADTVLRNGVFHAARLTYGLIIDERPDLDGWNDDCRVFEVRNHDRSMVGLYLLDLYARDEKRRGARSHALLEQSRMLEQLPVVCNNFDVAKPAAGDPTLLTLAEVTRLFHEFGHALHDLLSDVIYPSTAGTNVPRDIVEYPSQVNEMWAVWPAVVGNYAVHHQTGEPLPLAMASKVAKSQQINQGYPTYEHLAAAVLDQAWHALAAGERITDVDEFEKQALKRAGLDDPAIPPRYASTYFQHVFFGEYAARYYSYMWSEVLSADTTEWFADHAADLRAAGEAFRRKVLAVGGSRDAMAAYRDFRGSPPSVDALLRRRGLDLSCFAT